MHEKNTRGDMQSNAMHKPEQHNSKCALRESAPLHKKYKHPHLFSQYTGKEKGGNSIEVLSLSGKVPLLPFQEPSAHSTCWQSVLRHVLFGQALEIMPFLLPLSVTVATLGQLSRYLREESLSSLCQVFDSSDSEE